MILGTWRWLLGEQLLLPGTLAVPRNTESNPGNQKADPGNQKADPRNQKAILGRIVHFVATTD
jgi:hypothetical protein